MKDEQLSPGPTIEIRLLGQFEILIEGNAPTASAWRSRQLRTILKVLLTHRGRIVQADQLLEILWPEEPPEKTRQRLYVRISQLRRALDGDHPSAYVETVKDGYRFVAEADVWIDVDQFEAAAEAGRHAQEAEELEPAIAHYESAQSLYQGDFLEEELYEDWTFAERERLRERYLTVLTELAECYAQQGRYRRAITCCHQILSVDPCRESVYLRLMLYHYYAGEKTQALRVYERCQVVLDRELGLQPLPSTAQIARQIRQGTLWAVEDAPHYPPPRYQGRLFEVPYSLGHTPFVGREREYAYLAECWRTLETQVVLIEGEAGIGKTRLVEEFLGYAAAEGADVLRAGGGWKGKSLPYAPVISALRGSVEDEDGDDFAPSTLAALGLLFPEIRARQLHLPALPQLSPEEEQQRIFKAVTRFVEERFSPRTILFVDNAHRVDGPSLALLLRLAGHLTLILTCRTEETPADHPLRVALGPLRRAGRAADLQLAPLTTEDTRALIRRMAQDSALSLIDQLVDRAAGNPLFVIASLQHLFENGLLYVDAEGRWAKAGDVTLAVVPTVRRLIERRLRSLSQEQRRVFDAVAVTGGAFDFSLLPAVTNLDEVTLLDLVDGLIETGFLVEPRRAMAKEFAPTHDCYVEAAYDLLPAVRRRHLHRHIAQALEGLSPDLDTEADVLAHHYERAGCADEAFRWLVRAGDVAARRYAHPEALAYYQRAVDLDSADPGQVLMRMGHIAHHVARYAESVDFYTQALARWAAQDDPSRVVQTRFALAEAYRELSRYSEALEHASAGLKIAGSLREDRALEARGHIIVSNALRSGQLAPTEEVERHLQRALSLAQQLEDWQLMGEANFWLGVVTVNRGDPTDALAYDQQAMACFQRVDAAGWQAILYNNLAYHSLLAGRPEAALTLSREGLEQARRIGARHSEGWLLSTMGEIQIHLGHLEDARSTLEEGLSLVARWGPERLRPGFLHDLGQLSLAQQVWETARLHLEEAVALAMESAPQFVPQLRVTLARAHLGAGRPDEAEREAEQARAAAHQKEQVSVEGQALRVLAQVQARRERVASAEAAFAQSLALLTSVEDRLEAARVQAAWGTWLERQGDPRAEALLAAARSTFDRSSAVNDLRLLERRAGRALG